MGGVAQGSELRGGQESEAHGAAATENRHWHINVRVHVEFHDIKYATGTGVSATGHSQHGERSAFGVSGEIRANDRFE